MANKKILATPIDRPEYKPWPGFAKVVAAAGAVLTAKTVSKEILDERMATCSTCTFVRRSRDGLMHCGVCGCNLSSDVRKIMNLARYQEHLPKWGCKHPGRAAGKGWKR